MSAKLYRWSINVSAALCVLLVALILTTRELPNLGFLTGEDLSTFKTLFISIILEAIPFVLLGVLISSALQSFVSEQTIRRMIPKNPLIGVLFACTLGIIFPLCECGMIPVVRRLMYKGMPVYIAVVFILVGPILNPVVYASTYMAFRSRPEIAYSRMGLAFAAALIIGLLLARFLVRNPLKHTRSHEQYDHIHSHHKNSNRFISLLSHASDEFFEMGKYLMIGAMLTAVIQTFVARESLAAIGESPLASHLFMMGFAYVLSLCSTSDAFVASSFTTLFSSGSLLAFLVFGPMLDIKSTLMLLSVFKTRFVLMLSLLVTIVVLAGSLLFERLFLA